MVTVWNFGCYPLSVSYNAWECWCYQQGLLGLSSNFFKTSLDVLPIAYRSMFRLLDFYMQILVLEFGHLGKMVFKNCGSGLVINRILQGRYHLSIICSFIFLSAILFMCIISSSIWAVMLVGFALTSILQLI